MKLHQQNSKFRGKPNFVDITCHESEKNAKKRQNVIFYGAIEQRERIIDYRVPNEFKTSIHHASNAP